MTCRLSAATAALAVAIIAGCATVGERKQRSQWNGSGFQPTTGAEPGSQAYKALVRKVGAAVEKNNTAGTVQTMRRVITYLTKTETYSTRRMSVNATTGASSFSIYGIIESGGLTYFSDPREDLVFETPGSLKLRVSPDVREGFGYELPTCLPSPDRWIGGKGFAVDHEGRVVFLMGFE